VGNEAHQGLQQIINLLPRIPKKNILVDIPQEERPNPADLLPKVDADYWTYLGSLTTPPLLESVIWVVFQEPIVVSEDQVRE